MTMTKTQKIRDLQRQMADLYGKDSARVADLAIHALSLALEQVNELREENLGLKGNPPSQRLAA